MNYFEDYLLDFLLNVPAQDEFRKWRFEGMLMGKIREIENDQLEDVVQILYVCIDQLVKAKNLKNKFRLNRIADSKCNFL